MAKIIKKIKGKVRESSFDKSFYTDGHDVPIVCIGTQVIEIGDGYERGWNIEKDKDSFLWILDPDKEYEIIIKEAEDTQT